MTEITRSFGHNKGRNSGTKAGGFVWAVAVDPGNETDVYSQTKAALAEIDRVLADLGTDKTRLVNATVYVGKMEFKPEMERAWVEWVGDDPQNWPQRACVEAALEGYTLVEFVVIALAND